MTAAFTFSVRGEPKAKARPRFCRGRVVTTAKPKEKLWRSAVERAARFAVEQSGEPAPLFTGPVRVTMRFFFQPPPSALDRAGQPHTHKPDKDNLEKLVLDAMERAGVVKNDSQAAQGPTEKWWSLKPGVVVVVEPIEAIRVAPSEVEDEGPTWLTA